MSLTPGKTLSPGSTLGRLARTLARLFQASPSLGSWQKPEVGAPAGLCSGWKVGRPPAGNGKAQTLVMAGLLCLCIDVNKRRGICNFLPKMLRFPVTASECMLEPLLEPSCHHCLTLTSARPEPLCLRFLHQPCHSHSRKLSLGAPSTFPVSLSANSLLGPASLPG